MIENLIQEVIANLDTSSTPIIKPYFSYNESKIIIVGLKKGVFLKKHKAPNKAQILVIKGAIQFNINNESLIINTYQNYTIPIKAEHEVTGIDNAVFLLILSN